MAVDETKLGDKCQHGVAALLLSLDCACTDIDLARSRERYMTSASLLLSFDCTYIDTDAEEI